MTDLIAHLARLLALLFPARGKHRAALVPAPEPAPVSRAWSCASLPEHKSPYAREVAEKRPFVDVLNPVRPYVAALPRRHPDHPERRAQAERRWALEMALRGIDVGPDMIHGVHVGAGVRTVGVVVGA